MLNVSLLANVMFHNQARCFDHEATGVFTELPIELRNWIRSIANSVDRTKSVDLFWLHFPNVRAEIDNKVGDKVFYINGRACGVSVS